MNFVQASVTLASAATVYGAASLVLRAATTRIRLLALSVSLLTLCQIGSISSRLSGWSSKDLIRSLDILELTAGALSLAVIHLLNRENRERRQIEERLRVLEPLHLSNGLFRLAEQTGKAPRAADKRRSLRYRMHARSTIRLLNSPEAPVPCDVRDISQSGIGLIAGVSLEKQSEVEIELGGQRVKAAVARCQPAGFEFSIGLAFASELSRDRVVDIVRSTYVGAEAGRP